MLIRRLCIVGVGLMGGSLARALRQGDACAEIMGVGRRVEKLEKAVSLGVIDRYDTDIAQAVANADMVVLAVPVGALEHCFAAMDGHLAADAVVTDVGSVKRHVLKAAKAALGAIPDYLVPGHPIAGAEKSGIEAAIADLYQGRRVILTPTEQTDPNALDRVRAMWQATGAEVVEMEAGYHDAVLAATSHLPHVLAYTLVEVLGNMREHPDIFRNAAGGFRDFTRIASSDPDVWRDICLSNGDEIARVLALYREQLERMETDIRAGNGEPLHQMFRHAKALRDQYAKGDASND